MPYLVLTGQHGHLMSVITQIHSRLNADLRPSDDDHMPAQLCLSAKYIHASGTQALAFLVSQAL